VALHERDIHLNVAAGLGSVHKGNLPACKVLLVANSPVCRDGVAGEGAGKAPRGSVVKENKHQRARGPALVLMT